MSDKKHIDRIFQEKLKDFEVTPNPHVWENIQNQLDQNNNSTKKAFPLWARLASVAALLLLLLTIGNNVLNTNDPKVNSNENVVETNNSSNASDSETKSTNNSFLESDQNKTQEGLASDDSNNNSSNIESPSKQTHIVDPNSPQLSAGNSTQERSNTTPVKTQDGLSSKRYSNTPNLQDRVVTNSKEYMDRTTDGRKTPSVSKLPNSDNVVADNYSPANRSKNNADKVQNTKSSDVTDQFKNSVSKSRVTESSNTDALEFDKTKAEEAISNLNKTTQDAVVEHSGVDENQTLQEEENKETDKETSPSIEEEIAKAQDIIEEEKEKVNRWQVYANIAPVYYNTLGKGSHIDDQFVNNNKTGEINTSYGVNVSYAFNDRLSLRTGFNSLKLSYDTNNVIVYENVDIDIDTDSNPLRNLVFAESENGNNQLAVSAISQENLIVQQFNGTLGNNFESALSQRIGYYEIPVELKYRLVNKRFGVNVIGGVSTFILNENEVYSEFENRKRYIGETNNANDVSFSGNLGLGIDYEFSKKVKLNIEPTFKYQFNAFENTSGNFRPYIVGIYTGLSYKF